MRSGLFILLLIIGLGMQAQNQLKLVVTNIYPVKGEIFVAIYDDADNFLNIEFVAFQRIQAVKNETETILIPNMPMGEYAVSIFHDLNDNAELDTKMFGIPREPYGFSNNARGRMGPPKFEDAKFRLSGTLEITIEMANNGK